MNGNFWIKLLKTYNAGNFKKETKQWLTHISSRNNTQICYTSHSTMKRKYIDRIVNLKFKCINMFKI